MKNRHSLCKWTVPLCPWILHPHALQRAVNIVRDHILMNTMIPTWRVQEKTWLEDVLFYICVINLRMKNLKLQENNCLHFPHVLWVRLSFVIIKETLYSLSTVWEALEASIQLCQGGWCHIMSNDITSTNMKSIKVPQQQEDVHCPMRKVLKSHIIVITVLLLLYCMRNKKSARNNAINDKEHEEMPGHLHWLDSRHVHKSLFYTHYVIFIDKPLYLAQAHGFCNTFLIELHKEMESHKNVFAQVSAHPQESQKSCLLTAILPSATEITF